MRALNGVTHPEARMEELRERERLLRPWCGRPIAGPPHVRQVYRDERRQWRDDWFRYQYRDE